MPDLEFCLSSEGCVTSDRVLGLCLTAQGKARVIYFWTGEWADDEYSTGHCECNEPH